MITKNIQLDEQGRLKHFLSIEGFKRQHLISILDAAEPFANVQEQAVKKYRCCGAKPSSTCFLKPAPVPEPPLS